MLSSFQTKAASGNCWLHSLIAGTNCGACNDGGPSNQQYIYPSISTNTVPNPYPALSNTTSAQSLNPRRFLNPRVNILRSGVNPPRNHRVSKLANNYCSPLQSIHDHYPERFALSPEPRPRVLLAWPRNNRVNKRLEGYWPLQTVRDHYCERFALSPEPEERPRKRSRKVETVSCLSEDSEDRPVKRSRKTTTRTPEPKTLPEVSETAGESAILSRPSRSSQAKAKEMDDEAVRLADQADRLEETADELIADAKKLKLRARRQRKAGHESRRAREESTELESEVEGAVTRGRGKREDKEDAQSPRRTMRRRTPVSYTE